MKTKNIVIVLALFVVLIFGSCGKEVERTASKNKTFKPSITISSEVDNDSSVIEKTTTKAITTIPITTTKKEVDSSSIVDSSSVAETTVVTYGPEVPETMQVIEEPIIYEVIEEPVVEETQEVIVEDTEENNDIEETAQPVEEYVVYKPSTHYIHRSSCHWVTDECYKIENTNDIEAKKCGECNPDMEIVTEYKEPEPETPTPASNSWSGAVLSPSAGVVYGPSGKETYYNLDMSGVISIMRGMGFDAASYPYWVRSDGVKMLGQYCIVAANLDVHPRGSLVECSLGTAIVCDTGGFAYSNPNQLDIAVAWG